MNINMSMRVMKMVERCPVCGDETIGNGSKFIIDEDTFERTCRECGWNVTGKVEDNNVIITSDNVLELSNK